MKNASFKSITVLFIAFMLSLPAIAQYTAKEQKAINKSKDYYKSKKYDKAISTIKKVQDAHFMDDDLWTLRTLYEYDRYEDQLLADLIYILGKVADGKNIPANKTYKSDQYKSDLQVTCITATLVSSKQSLASAILYDFYIAPKVDTAISDEAKERYNKGNESFNNKEYSEAIRQFKKALDIEGNYYKATIGIADSYYNQENWDEAAVWYKKATRIENKMMKPHKRLTECYMNNRQWNDAYNACVNGIISYPDVEHFENLEKICEKQGKTFNRHWMARVYIPNVMNTQLGAIEKEPWSYYRQAYDKIASYCNDNGVIKRSQSMTEQRYLEAYSWEYMLKKSSTDDGEFKFARRVMDDGFVDCYAFISMYHILFRNQYEDFASKNESRIRRYIDEYLVK